MKWKFIALVAKLTHLAILVRNCPIRPSALPWLSSYNSAYYTNTYCFLHLFINFVYLLVHVETTIMLLRISSLWTRNLAKATIRWFALNFCKFSVAYLVEYLKANLFRAGWDPNYLERQVFVIFFFKGFWK